MHPIGVSAISPRVSTAYNSEESEDEDAPPHRHLTQNGAFQGITAFIILANTAIISAEAALIHKENLKPIFEWAEAGFTVLYVVEMALRVYECGLTDFFFGPDLIWDWFDFAITVAGVFDSVMSLLFAKDSGSSVCRIFRMLRILRLFRAFKFVSEFELVFMTSVKATFKLGVIVMTTVFVSAIVVTNLLFDSEADFRNLGASMWSVFLLMTLDNWSVRAQEVLAKRPEMWLFYVVFVFIAAIALMSLVPALFIEINMAKREKEKERMATRKKHERARKRRGVLSHLFALMDSNGDGVVSVAEMQAALEREGLMQQIAGADVRVIRLALFDLIETKFEETGSREHIMSRREFVDTVMKASDDVDNLVLWRSISLARLKMDKLERGLEEDFSELQSSVGEAKEATQDVGGDIAGLRKELSGLRCSVEELRAEVRTEVSSLRGSLKFALASRPAEQRGCAAEARSGCADRRAVSLPPLVRA